MSLEGQAREFSHTLGRILNTTVTTGISLNVVLRPQDRQQVVGWLGYQVTKEDLAGRPIPLTFTDAAPAAYLWLGQTLMVEEQTNHLVTRSARVALCLDSEGEEQLFRYDYNREPQNDYPSAHLQLYGLSERWPEFCQRRGFRLPTDRIHFPVGGKRFRPSLEDIVEFLIVEGFVSAQPGWKEGLAESRPHWEAVQVMASVRAQPHKAVEQLRQLGYTVTGPEEEPT